MLLNLALVGGAVGVALLIAWRVRRYDREVEGYHQREHTDPPTFGLGGDG